MGSTISGRALAELVVLVSGLNSIFGVFFAYMVSGHLRDAGFHDSGGAIPAGYLVVLAVGLAVFAVSVFYGLERTISHPTVHNNNVVFTCFLIQFAFANLVFFAPVIFGLKGSSSPRAAVETIVALAWAVLWLLCLVRVNYQFRPSRPAPSPGAPTTPSVARPFRRQ